METSIKCPICKKVMQIKNQDTSHDFKKRIEYKRIIFWCEIDDVWINIEVPKKLNIT